MLNFDFAALYEGRMTFAELVKDVNYSDVRLHLNELFSSIQSIVDDVTDADVTFLPQDPETQEENGLGWPLSHVLVHTTATLEETAALAAMLARGVAVGELLRYETLWESKGGLSWYQTYVEGCLRYETPWESIQTATQFHAHLKEGQRMCNAFLDAWPDVPHLDVTFTRVPLFGSVNAIAHFMTGIFHAQMHLDQLRTTLQQAKHVSQAKYI